MPKAAKSQLRADAVPTTAPARASRSRAASASAKAGKAKDSTTASKAAASAAKAGKDSSKAGKAGKASKAKASTTKPGSAKGSEPDAGSDAEVAAEDAAPIATPELLKRLADNEEEVRLAAVAAAARALGARRRALGAEDARRLWKGLWFALWHSDTPAAQQALARELAGLFSAVGGAALPALEEAFWAVLQREWETLDRYRVNKYYLLVRLVLRARLARLAGGGWDAAEVARFGERLVAAETGPLSYANARAPHGLRLHLVDIFVDELALAFEGAAAVPAPGIVRALLAPVLSQVELSEFKHIKQRVVAEVLGDERLAAWGVAAPAQPSNGAGAAVAGPADSDTVSSDWEGFD